MFYSVEWKQTNERSYGESAGRMTSYLFLLMNFEQKKKNSVNLGCFIIIYLFVSLDVDSQICLFTREWVRVERWMERKAKRTQKAFEPLSRNQKRFRMTFDSCFKAQMKNELSLFYYLIIGQEKTLTGLSTHWLASHMAPKNLNLRFEKILRLWCQEIGQWLSIDTLLHVLKPIEETSSIDIVTRSIDVQFTSTFCFVVYTFFV